MIEKLKSWKLIPEEGNYMCKNCGGKLTIEKNDKCDDEYMWMCKNDIIKDEITICCGYEVSLREGTFFGASRLKLWKILQLVNMWLFYTPTDSIMRELRMHMSTAIDWLGFCRELVYYILIEQQEKLGGEGIVVEIYVAKFKFPECGCEYCTPKNNEVQWIFGAYEQGTKHVFFETVPDNAVETIVPIIKKWICPGTTIIASCRQLNESLGKEGYKNSTPNYSRKYANKKTNSDLHGIKSFWGAAKTFLLKSGGIMEHIPGNLAKYLFQKRCRDLKVDCVIEFLKLAGEIYNPINPPNDSRPIYPQHVFTADEGMLVYEEYTEEEKMIIDSR